MKLYSLVLVVFYVYSNFAATADKRVGQVLTNFNDKKPVMKFYSTKTTHSKGFVYKATFLGLNKKVIAKEVSSYGADNQLIEYRIQQNQYGCQARVVKKGSKYQLLTRANGASQSKVTLPNAAQIFSSYGIETIIAKNWKALQAGQIINFTFYTGCNIKPPSVVLQLKKVKPRKIGGQTFVTIESSHKKSKKKGFYHYDSNKKLHAYSGPLQVTLKSSPVGAILF